MSERHVKGLSELQKFLDTLAPRVEKNIMRGALRAGMNTVKPVAQSNVHSVSGLLAKGLRVGTRARGGTVTASLKATGPHAFIARFVEYGTRPHVIRPKSGGVMALGTGIFRSSVMHPGARPKPFMRPALDSQASNAVVAAGEYMKRRLATKHGLDTAHITVEGDE
jgi:HK97 gp10 family phage protein